MKYDERFCNHCDWNDVGIINSNNTRFANITAGLIFRLSQINQLTFVSFFIFKFDYCMNNCFYTSSQ